MPKKQMKFKGGGKVKRYSGATDDGSYVSDDEENPARKAARERQAGADFMNATETSVIRALRGERPPAPEYTQLPPSKDNSFIKAAQKVQKSQASDPRMLEAGMSRGAISASTPFEQRPRSARLNAEAEALESSHPEMILNPASMGIKTIATGAKALANMGGRNALKLAGEAGEGILSAAGQRLKDLSQLRNTMFPGRNAAVTNPNAWAAGPKGMEKIAETEGRAAAAEARAATAAAKKKAAQAKKDAKDPVMSARPGADQARSASKYETDEPMDISFGYKKGGVVKKFAKGGSVSSASSRADGIAIRGKTKGTISKMRGGGMYKGKK